MKVTLAINDGYLDVNNEELWDEKSMSEFNGIHGVGEGINNEELWD